MRLQHITITDMAGFHGVSEFDLPAVALISALNGAGKSSLTDTLRYAFDRGHDDDMVHADAEQGEAIISFDDGAAVRVSASRKLHQTTRAYRAPGERKWNVSRAVIDKISAAISYNALSLMELPEKKQIETLMELMPVTVTDDEINAAIGEAMPEAEALLESKDYTTADGLGKIDLLLEEREGHTSIYNSRREKNVSREKLEAHASELERAIPPPAPQGTDWVAEVRRLQSELDALSRAETATVASLGKELDKQKDEAREWMTAQNEAIDKEIDAKIRTLEAERDTRKSEVRTHATTVVDEARNAANEKARQCREENAGVRATLTAERATAEERAAEHERTEGTRQAAVVAREQAIADGQRAEVLSDAVRRLRELRITVAERLPIKGIRIVGGRLLNMDNVPFKRWNTAQQVIFCLKIAVMAHGEAGFVCIDKAESIVEPLWSQMLAACKKYAETEGMQFLICKAVGNQGLKVEAL